MDADMCQLVKRKTLLIVPRSLVVNAPVFPSTWSFECKIKPDISNRKFNLGYFVRKFSEEADKIADE